MFGTMQIEVDGVVVFSSNDFLEILSEYVNLRKQHEASRVFIYREMKDEYGEPFDYFLNMTWKKR